MNIRPLSLSIVFVLTIASSSAQALEIHNGKLLSSRLEKSPHAIGEFISTKQALSAIKKHKEDMSNDEPAYGSSHTGNGHS